MSVDFKLPDLGEGIHEAEIISIKVKEGETVKEDQALMEVETDKAVVEIPCPYNGVISKVHVKEGATVTTGSVMISFELNNNSQTKEPAVATAGTLEKKKKETATEPAAKSLPSKGSERESTTGGAHRQSETAGNGRSNKALHDPNRPVPAAPAVRRLARELGVDLYTVAGSGPAGRVLKEDVRAFATGTLSRMASSHGTEENGPRPEQPAISLQDKYGGSGSGTAYDATPMAAQPVELPDFERFGKIERVPLRSIRRKIAMNMTLSWTHIPHVTHFDEANVTALVGMIARREAQKKLPRLTLTALTVKAIVSALKKYPQFNSSLDEAKGEIVFKQYFNIGVAVATERGLIVPVIHNANEKSLKEIALDLADIAVKTRSGKIELDRLQGGTFTITNIGAIGGTSMVPMVNYPEAAILGMARASERPIVKNGAIEIGTILPLALSFDHRLADGAEAAFFVRHVIDLLEDPMSLLLDEA